MKNLDRFTLYMLFLAPTAYSNAQVSVLTQHNDLARTGQNTQETILTTANVNASTGNAARILRAFDATDLSNELWNSQIMASRDSVGNFAKFVNPTIANGKVYLATFSDELAVYGLLQDQRLGNIDHMNFDVSVSPNPAKDVINFKVSDPQINLSRIEIIDEYGKVILNNIDVSQFLPGTYFIKFYSEGGLVAKKVSIVK